MNGKGNVVMPIEAFDALESILKNPDTDVDRSFSAFGYKWGERMVDMIEERCSRDELKQYVKQISWEAGISKMELVEVGQDIKITVRETGIDNTDFLGGFLSGVISRLLSGEEESEQFGYELIDEGEDKITFKVSEIRVEGGVEKEEKEPMKYSDLNFGEKYLVLEEDPVDAEKSFDILHDFVTHGSPGLCMTTSYPSKIKERYGFESTEIIWLTDYKTGSSEFRELDPKRLEFEISRDARKFLKEGEESVLMVHGIEYLIRHNGFDKVSDFMDTLSRIIYANDNMLICPIYPNALREIDYSNLKTVFKVIGERND
ncbi:MAG: DUF835 domain-containing protein [Thermoplasmatota archaeon]